MDGCRRDRSGNTGVDISGKGMSNQCLGGLSENLPDPMVTWLVQNISQRVKGEMHGRLVGGQSQLPKGTARESWGPNAT